MVPALIRFRPIYQTRIWGGRALAEEYARPLPGTDPVGESWELVDRPDAQSVVVGGPLDGMTLHELWTRNREAVFGVDAPVSERFPLLIKLLDAEDVLSLQVHPPAKCAAALGGEPKTECWTFLCTEPDACIYAGLRPGVTRADFEEALHAGQVASCFHRIATRAGDVMFLPSGRVHAIGAGNLILEVQQNSDTTYRVYDWDRMGMDGNPRPLHVEQSLAAINFNDHSPALEARDGARLVRCDVFQVWELTPATRHAVAAALAGRAAHVFVHAGEVGTPDGILQAGESGLLTAGLDWNDVAPARGTVAYASSW
jgi:mannose-6-phosphate isomerase